MTSLAVRTAAWGGWHSGLALSGCAAATTAVAKRNLDVQTKMSDTVFLDPVRTGRADRLRRYPQHLRPSGLDIGAAGPSRRRGARLSGGATTPAPHASCCRPTCCRRVETPRPRPRRRTIRDSAAPSWAVPRAGLPATALGQAGIGVNDALGAIGGALAGAAISTLADAYMQDTTYTIVTDVQVSERVPGGAVVSQSEQANLAQGTSGTVTQSSSQTADAKRYRTRVVSTANQVNLDWPAAEPQLVAGLSRSIGGIF